MALTKKITTFFTIIILLLVSAAAFGLTVNYQYDDLYRLTRVERSDGLVIEYQYDTAGNRLAKIIKVLAIGDLNGNGSVTLTDALLALKIMSGINPSPYIFKNTNVNRDNKIGLPEVIFIFQKAAEVR